MDWKKLSDEIGPLRYQMSEADCVPTTIINALLVVRRRPLKPKLLHLIWSVSIDQNAKGTGWACSQLLAHVLQSWFTYASTDKYERGKILLRSDIVEGENVSLDKNNRIARCLNSKGVVCLTTSNGGHYCLLITKEENYYLGFDPSWNSYYSTPEHSDDYRQYHGLVNVCWTREELISELSLEANKWIHTISPLTEN